MVRGDGKFMNAYPTFTPFIKSIGKYMKSKSFAGKNLSPTTDTSKSCEKVFGIFRSIIVVLVLEPFSIWRRLIENSLIVRLRDGGDRISEDSSEQLDAPFTRSEKNCSVDMVRWSWVALRALITDNLDRLSKNETINLDPPSWTIDSTSPYLPKTERRISWQLVAPTWNPKTATDRAADVVMNNDSVSDSGFAMDKPAHDPFSMLFRAIALARISKYETEIVESNCLREISRCWISPNWDRELTRVEMSKLTGLEMDMRIWLDCGMSDVAEDRELRLSLLSTKGVSRFDTCPFRDIIYWKYSPRTQLVSLRKCQQKKKFTTWSLFSNLEFPITYGSSNILQMDLYTIS